MKRQVTPLERSRTAILTGLLGAILLSPGLVLAAPLESECRALR